MQSFSHPNLTNNLKSYYKYQLSCGTHFVVNQHFKDQDNNNK